jgi:molybdopterin-guanine dinucleotide biosynthesis protein MobB
LGFVAPSGTGKTTLLRQVLHLLVIRGIQVGVVKQARDDFDVDVPGKDSYRLRKAGVERLMLASERKTALMIEHPGGGEPQLEALLRLLDQKRLDLILIEGFSEQPFPKIELHREQFGTRLRCAEDPWIVAVATDRPGVLQLSVPELDINQPARVAEFVLTFAAELRKKLDPETRTPKPNE